MERYALAGPSLALTKYWGKAKGGINLPATPSVAVTLKELYSVSRCRLTDRRGEDSVTIAGVPQKLARFEPVFAELRRLTGYTGSFAVESGNNFPTAAGLASSASGLAALVTAAAGALDSALPKEELSRIARIGSGSAARSIFGGFTLLPAEAEHASPLYEPDYWPEFRILAVALYAGPKPLSSREAMRRSVESSPYFGEWVRDARRLTDRALDALAARDIESLGTLARESYTRMFATMISASPPVIYWRPESVALIHKLESMREAGRAVYETMDAGPQVKIILPKEEVEGVTAELESAFPEAGVTVCSPGEGARLMEPSALTSRELSCIREGS